MVFQPLQIFLQFRQIRSGSQQRKSNTKSFSDRNENSSACLYMYEHSTEKAFELKTTRCHKSAKNHVFSGSHSGAGDIGDFMHDV